MRKASAVIIAVFLLSSCGRTISYPPAGSYSNIVMVTETGKIDGAAEVMLRELQHIVDYYNKQELQFKVMLVSAREMEKHTPTKNMVIFGIVDRGRIGSILEKFLGTAGMRRVHQGENNVFKKMDYPVSGQFTVVVTASSEDELTEVALKNGERIREIIEEANRERLRNYLLSKERIDVSELLLAKYGFTVRVPSLYRMNQDRSEVPGVEIVRTQPHRGLTVSWRPWKESGLTLADSTELYEARSDVAWNMYDKDVMRRDIVFFYADELGPYQVVRMEGYWENSEDLFGGPFKCFFLYDDIRSRLWIIDCVVYAPGFEKHKLLRELHCVAETFRIN